MSFDRLRLALRNDYAEQHLILVRLQGASGGSKEDMCYSQ
jgi:hypothetical protein